jgi:V8-like Glu-specific endopeptidase
MTLLLGLLFYISSSLLWNPLAYSLNANFSRVIETPSSVEKSVRYIEIHDRDKKVIGVCTGVFVSDSLLVTAAHCIDHVKQKTSTDPVFIDRQSKAIAIEFKSLCSRFISDYRCPDISFFSFPKGTYLGPTWNLRLAALENSTEQSGFAYDYGTWDDRHKEIDGRLRLSSGRFRIDEFGMWSINQRLGFQPGDSGGPILNDQGEIIGIISNTDGMDRGSYFLIPEDTEERNEILYFASNITKQFVTNTNCSCVKRQFAYKKKLFTDDYYLDEVESTSIIINLPFFINKSDCSILNQKPSPHNFTIVSRCH